MHNQAARIDRLERQMQWLIEDVVVRHLLFIEQQLAAIASKVDAATVDPAEIARQTELLKAPVQELEDAVAANSEDPPSPPEKTT